MRAQERRAEVGRAAKQFVDKSILRLANAEMVESCLVYKSRWVISARVRGIENKWRSLVSRPNCFKSWSVKVVRLQHVLRDLRRRSPPDSVQKN